MASGSLVRKKVFANLVISFCAFWTVFDFISFREDFPFAPYTMYASAFDRDHENFHIVFINENGEEVVPNSEWLGTMDPVRLNFGLRSEWLAGRETVVEERLKRLLVTANQKRTLTERPLIRGIRLYKSRSKVLLREYYADGVRPQ